MQPTEVFLSLWLLIKPQEGPVWLTPVGVIDARLLWNLECIWFCLDENITEQEVVLEVGEQSRLPCKFIFDCRRRWSGWRATVVLGQLDTKVKIILYTGLILWVRGTFLIGFGMDLAPYLRKDGTKLGNLEELCCNCQSTATSAVTRALETAFYVSCANALFLRVELVTRIYTYESA